MNKLINQIRYQEMIHAFQNFIYALNTWYSIMTLSSNKFVVEKVRQQTPVMLLRWMNVQTKLIYKNPTVI